MPEPNEVAYVVPDFVVGDRLQIMTTTSDAHWPHYEGNFQCLEILSGQCIDGACRFPRHRARHGSIRIRGYEHHAYCAARFTRVGYLPLDWIELMGGNSFSACRHLAYPHCICSKSGG